MRRGCVGALFVVTAASASLWLVPAVADEARSPSCTERSWTAGTVERCDGALVYRDYVYDDTGADLQPLSPHGATTAMATGDVDHRDHGQHLNTTDLLVLRVSRVEGGLAARFELGALGPYDATIAALAVDVDDDATTGGGRWVPIAVRSAGWDVMAMFDQRDADADVVEGFLPVTLPETGTVRLQAVVALGDGTPMNVAFRGRESGDWWEAEQSSALAVGDISAFGLDVAVADLGRPGDEPAPLGTGLMQRVYRSDVELGEGYSEGGVVGQTGSVWNYVGRHQPYGLYVPDDLPDDVQVLLHGATSAPMAMVGARGMREAFGDQQHRILVAPLGRGETGGYVDWSARDVFDALADVEATYATDPDTVVLSGYSMGGGGALTLGAWFPDRWAAVIGWVPFTGDCLNGTPLAQGDQHLPGLPNSPADRDGCPLAVRGNALDLYGNLRHVPTALAFGMIDELVWPNHALASGRRFADLGYEHRVRLGAHDHFLLATLDDWREDAGWSADRRRVERPAHVTYRTNTYLWFEEGGLVPDGAYWVDELRPRVDRPTADGDMVVDLTSHACPDGDAVVQTVAAAGLDPVPWVGQEGRVTARATTSGARRITGRLTNVASVLIDVERACLAPGEPVEVDVRSDGPAAIRFTDGRAPVVVG